MFYLICFAKADGGKLTCAQCTNVNVCDFDAEKYIAPVSTDLCLGRYSGLKSLNFMSISNSAATEQELEDGLQRIWRPTFTLRPDTLEKLSCVSGSLQRLWVAFNDDIEVKFGLFHRL